MDRVGRISVSLLNSGSAFDRVNNDCINEVNPFIPEPNEPYMVRDMYYNDPRVCFGCLCVSNITYR